MAALLSKHENRGDVYKRQANNNTEHGKKGTHFIVIDCPEGQHDDFQRHVLASLSVNMPS